MLEFFCGPDGVTLVFDSAETSGVAEFLPSSRLCGNYRRLLPLVPAGTPDESLPPALLDQGGPLLEAAAPGCLRERKTGKPYSPAAGDVLRLWSGGAPCSRAAALNLAFGWMSGSALLVDLDSLSHNLRSIRRNAGAGLTAMVKCDGYGTGAAPAARACLEAGASRLAVTSLREALELRRAGIDAPLLVLNFDCAEARAIVYSGCEAVVYLPAQAESLASAARELGLRASAHLKVDTGLGRYGVPVEEVKSLLERWRGNDSLQFTGLMTHLSHANEPLADTLNRAQLELFDSLARSLGDLLPPVLHAANSSGTARYPEAAYSFVRPGAVLYGLRPYPGIAESLGLRRVLAWSARVAQVRSVPPGRRVGYGGMFITRRPSRIATVLAGYGDGYPGSLANRARVLVHGNSAPVVGAVSMDCICVDLTDLDREPVPGDEVVLLGEEHGPAETPGEEYISPEECAAAAGMSAYEFITRIGPRVCRIYRSSV